MQAPVVLQGVSVAMSTVYDDGKLEGEFSPRRTRGLHRVVIAT